MIGYSVIQRRHVGDKNTTRDTRLCDCSSIEEFKKLMQEIHDDYYLDNDKRWKLEAPQIFDSAFDKEKESKGLLHFTDFCDSKPKLIWQEKEYDFTKTWFSKLIKE